MDTDDRDYLSYKRNELRKKYVMKYTDPYGNEEGNAQMFIIEGMDKVREVIEKNRSRKLTKHKKLSNNTLIEIDSCSPLELLKLQTNLTRIAEGITFVTGKGKRKPPIQQLYEELEECGARLLQYKDCFEIMGKDRNSYSKTDVEATFMRMKEDHMLNGQLKPAYNVQIAVENYFIIHSYISCDRTDYTTLIPVLEKHRTAFGNYPEDVTADSGYCSEKNLLYLKEHNITSYIKQQDGYEQTVEVYGCADCSDCPHKSKCLYKYDAEKDADKNKVMKINERWEDLKEESHANIQSEKGILNRQIRSIQTESHFGDIKENEDFRRFNYRSSEKVYKEFLLYAIGRNLNKYHRFLHGKIRKFEGKKQCISNIDFAGVLSLGAEIIKTFLHNLNKQVVCCIIALIKGVDRYD